MRCGSLHWTVTKMLSFSEIEVHLLSGGLWVEGDILLICVMFDSEASITHWGFGPASHTFFFIFNVIRLVCTLEILCLFLLRWSFVEGSGNLSCFEHAELDLTWHRSCSISLFIFDLMQFGDKLPWNGSFHHKFLHIFSLC